MAPLAVLGPGAAPFPGPRRGRGTLSPLSDGAHWLFSPFPGSHRSEYTGTYNRCTEGVDYTNASNNLFSCLPCRVCISGTECVNPLPRGGVQGNEMGVVAISAHAQTLPQPQPGSMGGPCRHEEPVLLLTPSRGHCRGRVAPLSYYLASFPSRVPPPSLCVPRCPSGKVLVSNCMSWSDIGCVEESGANATVKTPAAEETVTTSSGTPASCDYLLCIIMQN
ncbi:tumor necrosis factor receptor superfamily member 10C-like [Sapajus apella]|uniref:Tumor necrosis factor receptor superfamily member 10C-like n=1 Tax=Sapajus apella TaxID=9515 RepID=A0A6J3IPL3_SAPAP|nr:tumor necrosis factor receptor superfamily member 10C-like [Sapajus apella]